MAFSNDFKSVVICCGKYCSQLAVFTLALRSFEAVFSPCSSDIWCLKALWPAVVCHIISSSALSTEKGFKRKKKKGGGKKILTTICVPLWIELISLLFTSNCRGLLTPSLRAIAALYGDPIVFSYNILKIFREDRVSTFGFKRWSVRVILVIQSDYTVKIRQSLNKDQRCMLNTRVYVNALQLSWSSLDSNKVGKHL